MAGKTLYDKLWDAHIVRQNEDGTCLLYVDRHLVHEVTSPQAFEGLREAARRPWRVDANLATADHNVPTTDRAQGIVDAVSRLQVETLDANCRDLGITEFGMNDPRQGIVHVIGPEQGATLPGMTVVCGDSHTSTHGAFGALAFGIGTSEVEHVLATQCLIQKKSKTCACAWREIFPRHHCEGYGAGNHWSHRHRRRQRLRRRIRRQRDRAIVGRRPHDSVQHGDRGRRARRHGCRG